MSLSLKAFNEVIRSADDLARVGYKFTFKEPKKVLGIRLCKC
jgi:hypothetical protein